MKSPSRRRIGWLGCEFLEDRHLLATLVGEGQIVAATCDSLLQQDVPCEKFLDAPVTLLEEVRILPAHMDLNGDSRVSVTDLVLLASAFGHDLPDTEAYDMDRDGRFSLRDVIEVVNVLADDATRRVAIDFNPVDTVMESFAQEAIFKLAAENPLQIPSWLASMRDDFSTLADAFEYASFDLIEKNGVDVIALQVSVRGDQPLVQAVDRTLQRLETIFSESDLADYSRRDEILEDSSTRIVIELELPADTEPLNEVVKQLDTLLPGSLEWARNWQRVSAFSSDHGTPAGPFLQVQGDRIRVYTYDWRFMPLWL